MRAQLSAALVLLGLATVAAADNEPATSSLGAGMSIEAPSLAQIQAEQHACESKKVPRKANGTISEGTYKRMERIVDQIAKGEYADAEKKLIDLAADAHGDYEKAIILQTLGFAYASQKNKEDQAIHAFEQAIATNALPQQAHEEMMFNVAQLYVAGDKWDKGIAALNAYLAETCNPKPDAHILLASVYAEKKQWKDMLKQVDLAIVKAKVPKEQWLLLKLAGHYELKEMNKCAEVLVALVGLAPDKAEYWKQLHGVLFEIKRDPEALAVMGLAERRGYYDNEREVKNLANMYFFMQIPMKSAMVMQKGLDSKVVTADEKNLSFLGDAYLAAREYDKSEVAMKKAASVSDKGEIWYHLAQVQMESEKWKDALESLQKALQKGGLKDPGDAALRAGSCAVQLRQWKAADGYLRTAMTHEKSAKQAGELMNYMQQEIAYAEKMGEPEKPAAETIEQKKDVVQPSAETKKN